MKFVDIKEINRSETLEIINSNDNKNPIYLIIDYEKGLILNQQFGNLDEIYNFLQTVFYKQDINLNLKKFTASTIVEMLIANQERIVIKQILKKAIEYIEDVEITEELKDIDIDIDDLYSEIK